MELLGYFLAILVGVTLGLIGGGGAILSVPILVYIQGIDPMTATTYSLFIVGVTSLSGLIKRAKDKNVDFKTGIIFGIPSILVVFVVRNMFLPIIPNELFVSNSIVITKSGCIMAIFAIVMITASISMIQSGSKTNRYKKIKFEQLELRSIYKIISLAILVGLVTGFVGAGGGFLIIPALVLFRKMPMEKAIGTSLLIIALNSAFGFFGSFSQSISVDWKLLISFTCFSIAGVYAGTVLSNYISGEKLKSIFGWFVFLMGIFIIIKELFQS